MEENSSPDRDILLGLGVDMSGLTQRWGIGIIEYRRRHLCWLFIHDRGRHVPPLGNSVQWIELPRWKRRFRKLSI